MALCHDGDGIQAYSIALFPIPSFLHVSHCCADLKQKGLTSASTLTPSLSSALVS